jgi:hypothetical protein
MSEYNKKYGEQLGPGVMMESSFWPSYPPVTFFTFSKAKKRTYQSLLMQFAKTTLWKFTKIIDAPFFIQRHFLLRAQRDEMNDTDIHSGNFYS